jgi:hypothetical protein
VRASSSSPTSSGLTVTGPGGTPPAGSPLQAAPRAHRQPGRGRKGDDRRRRLDGERLLYCLVAHGAALREALGAPILADRITLDYRRAGLDKRRTAILDFATKITERPLDCDPEDLERLKGFGLTEAEVWDVIETSCS